MQKFVDLINKSIKPVKYIGLVVGAIAAALAAYHAHLDAGTTEKEVSNG
ncbi:MULTISPECIES: hypothetical protein [Chitinophagaceae]